MQLKIIQPALSRNIRVLEERVGVVILFNRSQPEVTPTVYEQCLINLGKPIFLDSQKLELEISLLKRDEQGSLECRCRLNTCGSLCRAPPHVGLFNETHQ